MPSQKILEQKKQLVAELGEKLKNSCAGVIVDYSGTSVADDTKLRRELREAGVEYRVVKNTYLRFALKDAGIEGVDDCLEGTTAIGFSENDELAAAKVLCKFADEHENFTVKAGYSDGKALDVETINQLAKVPSREALLSMFIGGLNQTIAGLARALNAVAEQKGEAAPAEA